MDQPLESVDSTEDREAIMDAQQRMLDGDDRPPPGSMVGKILDALEHGPQNVDALMVFCDGDIKKVRNAITALRRRYEAGNELHVVSFEAKYWLARDIEAQGYQLVETPGGNLKVKKDDAPVTADNASDLLKEFLGDRELTPEAVTQLIANQLEISDQAQAALRRVREAMKELEGGKEAGFRDAVQRGRDINDSGEAVDKLMQVEQSWQELEEARAQATEERKIHREALAEEVKKLRSIMKAAKSLNIVETLEDAAEAGR